MFCSFYYYYTLSRVFHANVSWWSSTWIWATASLLMFPWLFSVFWLILMLKSGSSLLVFWYLSFLIYLQNLSTNYSLYSRQLFVPCFLGFFFLVFGNIQIHISLFVFFFFLCGILEQQSQLFYWFFFLLTIIRSGLQAQIRWSACIENLQSISGVTFYQLIHLYLKTLVFFYRLFSICGPPERQNPFDNTCFFFFLMFFSL